MTDRLTELVARNAELRELLQGRLPERIYWKWQTYLVATADFTPLEHGVYILLLHYELRKGRLPTGTESLALVCKLPVDQFNAAWSTVQDKFIELEGSFYNETLEQEFNIAATELYKKRQGGKAKKSPSSTGLF